jgi:hypothetical protein
MVPVKIECDCGQHYAFDVEPVNGRMSFPVACPTCGVDGTGTANEIIAGKMALMASAPPPPIPVRAPVRAPEPAEDEASLVASTSNSGSGLHLSGTMHAPGQVSTVEATAPAIAKIPKAGTYSADQLGLVSKEQAAVEAKAKVLWGEGQDSVVKYLMMQSYSYQEAADLVGVLFKARLADLRKKGIGKIIQGIGMMFVPVIGYFLNMMMISFIVMGIMAMVGVFGFYLLITGTVMVVAPKTETGDVAED